MRVLRVFAHLVGARPPWNAGRRSFDEVLGGVSGRIGDARRVGAHVGDQALGAFARRDRRPRIAPGRAASCGARGSRSLRDASCCSVEVVNGAAGLRRTSRCLTDGDLNAAPSRSARRSRPRSRRRRSRLFARRSRRVRPENERIAGLWQSSAPIVQYSRATNALDLAFAVDDQLDRDRLHAPGREAAADFGPEQRRDLVAHQPVEDAARLLRVHAVHVDRVRVAPSRRAPRLW